MAERSILPLSSKLKRGFIIGLEIAMGATACGPAQSIEDRGCIGYPVRNVWDTTVFYTGEFVGADTIVDKITIKGRVKVEPVPGTFRDKEVTIGGTVYKPQDGLMKMDGGWETVVATEDFIDSIEIVYAKHLSVSEVMPNTMRVCVTPEGLVLRNYYPDTP